MRCKSLGCLVGTASYGPFMDAKTEELRAAHDVLAEFYAGRLADALDHMPAERAMLGLFCDLTLAAGLGTNIADVGCGTGRLEPYLAARGLSPRGADLSPEMIRVARRDHPGFGFDVADLRELPFEDASLAGVVCWYSLMYLAPSDRPAAFSELARVVAPGGYLVTAFKAGDSQVRRGGRSLSLGVEFDVYWLSPGEMERRVNDAGFTTVFWGGRPAQEQEGSPQGYLLAQRSLRPLDSHRRTPSARQNRQLGSRQNNSLCVCVMCLRYLSGWGSGCGLAAVSDGAVVARPAWEGKGG